MKTTLIILWFALSPTDWDIHHATITHAFNTMADCEKAIELVADNGHWFCLPEGERPNP